jgi:hypothetical protein
MKLPMQTGPVPRSGSMGGTASTHAGLNPSYCLGISATIENHQACIHLPIVGSKCISVPHWIPNGKVASVQACTCSDFHVPCGFKATVKVAGETVASKSFGCC